MKTGYTYDVPFEHYEWRKSLHDILIVMFVEAATTVLKKLPGEGFDYMDEEGQVKYVLDKDLLPEIMAEMKIELKCNYLR